MREAIPTLTQYAFMAWRLVKAQGQLYIYLYLPSITPGKLWDNNLQMSTIPQFYTFPNLPIIIIKKIDAT
jgi:hypothetical protein